MAREHHEDLVAKDLQIDVLIEQQDRLLEELRVVAANLKRVLTSGQSDLDVQKDTRDRGRG